MGIDKNSVLPIQPLQFSREVYHMGSTQYDNMNLSANLNAPGHMGSTQYDNMNFSANLNAPGAKTAVSTKKSVPMSEDKSCPIQDSLHHHRGNGEGISHSWSISACAAAEDQQVIDARKQKRMLSNRESARRSRLRKQLRLNELNAQVAYLKAENGQIQNKLNIASQQYAQITEENYLLKIEAVKLSHEFQGLHYIITAQSGSAYKTMSIETGNCSAAHLSSESGIIPNSFTSPDFLF